MAKIENFKDKKLSDKLIRTNLADIRTKRFVGDILRKEFDKPESGAERCADILAVAYHLNVPQFDDMLQDYSFEDFKL